MTCGVAVKVVDKVLDSIRRACKRGGVRARLITSGDGEWRYLDIVSNQAVSVLRMLSAAGVNCRRAGWQQPRQAALDIVSDQAVRAIRIPGFHRRLSTARQFCRCAGQWRPHGRPCHDIRIHRSGRLQSVFLTFLARHQLHSNRERDSFSSRLSRRASCRRWSMCAESWASTTRRPSPAATRVRFLPGIEKLQVMTQHLMLNAPCM